MTQKPSNDQSGFELLQTIDPKGIADESVRRTVEILLNLVEELNSKVKGLELENQHLRDENNRLKGEQGKPDIKAKNNKGNHGNHSSEKERQTPKKHSKGNKNESIKIDREEILEYPKQLLPADAQFKGYVRGASRREEVIVQDIKLITALKLLPQETVFSCTQFDALLDTYLPKLGSVQRTRVLEAAAIAFYHQQTDWPVVHTLLCDDAPQFKLITDDLALCWVHEGRHYKKLSPVVAYHQEVLDEFLDEFWDYYRELLAYRDSPSAELAPELKSKFWKLFDTKSGYEQLDERKRLTAAKASELLLVLQHPELPLHNNPAELAARTMVQRRNISYATQTTEGTRAWDTFMSLVATTRKLGISFFEYVCDRISQSRIIPSLATIIREKSSVNPFGWSWQPE